MDFQQHEGSLPLNPAVYLKMEVIKYFSGLDLGYEKKIQIKDEYKFLNPSN